jgi:uncharacterized membrane protein
MRHFTLCFAFVAMLSACGGKNQPEPVVAPAADAPAIAPPIPTGTPSELEAESGLSVKRGLITLTAQTRSFRLCGTSVDLTLTDQLDGALDRAYADLGGKPMYAEVYGERGLPDAGSNAPSTFNVEELLFASGNPQTACDLPLGQYELLARGSNPTWSVEIKQDTMVFKQTGAPTEIKFAAAETAETEGTVTYRAGVDRYVLELVVAQSACRDVEANEYYAYTATARLNKQVFNGCARVGE